MTVPARLSHFLLLKIIGMGGMGGVYRAHDEVLNRAVAIKVMRKSLGDNTIFSETFLREAQAAARAGMIASFVIGRWHRFAKTGFRHGMAEAAPAQLAMLLA